MVLTYSYPRCSRGRDDWLPVIRHLGSHLQPYQFDFSRSEICYTCQFNKQWPTRSPNRNSQPWTPPSTSRKAHITNTVRRFCRDGAISVADWISLQTLPYLNRIPFSRSAVLIANIDPSQCSEGMDGSGETVTCPMPIPRALQTRTIARRIVLLQPVRDSLSATSADSPSARTSVPSHFNGLCGVHYQVAATRAECTQAPCS